jgi:hypothetical protein
LKNKSPDLWDKIVAFVLYSVIGVGKMDPHNPNDIFFSLSVPEQPIVYGAAGLGAFGILAIAVLIYFLFKEGGKGRLGARS